MIGNIDDLLERVVDRNPNFTVNALALAKDDLADHPVVARAISHAESVRRKRSDLGAHAEVALKRHVFAERRCKIADVVELGTAHARAGVPDSELSRISAFRDRLALDLHEAAF